MDIAAIPQQSWFIAEAAARGDRDALARFWLAAPEDILESLWNSPLGEATRALVQQLHPQFPFTPDQLRFRDALSVRLQQGLDQPAVVQLLLAAFLYSPAGQFRIASAERWLPGWLLPHYQALYETSVPNGSLSAPAPSAVSQPVNDGPVPTPDFGPFPQTLQELIGNRIQLNRMLGLANLYYIDPEDQEILQDLVLLRQQFAAAIERCSEADLERLWATDLGDRYWAMVRSGVQKEPMSPEDESLKQRAVQRLSPAQGGGFHAPGATNAFLVAMLFYVPGTMKVDDAEQKLPAWLLGGYQDVFAQSIATQV